MLKEKIIMIAVLILSLVKTDTLDTTSYYEKFNIALESFKLGRYKLAQNQFQTKPRKNSSKESIALFMIPR